MEKAKKGDRVEFKMEDGMNYGVVKKGGRNTIVVVLDGGDSEVKAGVRFFRLSDKPLPTDKPNMMDKYSIKGYKEGGMNTDGLMFSCTLCLYGKPIAHISQGGHGGPNSYQFIVKDYKNDTEIRASREVLNQFYKDTKAWAALFNYENPLEIEDDWVEWWLHMRPYGRTAEAYITQMDAELKELRAQMKKEND